MGMRQTRTTYRRLRSGWQQSVSLTAPVVQEVQQFLHTWPTQTGHENDHQVSCDQCWLEPGPEPLRDPHSDR